MNSKGNHNDLQQHTTTAEGSTVNLISRPGQYRAPLIPPECWLFFVSCILQIFILVFIVLANNNISNDSRRRSDQAQSQTEKTAHAAALEAIYSYEKRGKSAPHFDLGGKKE